MAETFLPVEKQLIIDALSQQMQVTARAARMAQEKGHNEVATGYHKINARVLDLKAKIEKNL